MRTIDDPERMERASRILSQAEKLLRASGIEPEELFGIYMMAAVYAVVGSNRFTPEQQAALREAFLGDAAETFDLALNAPGRVGPENENGKDQN